MKKLVLFFLASIMATASHAYKTAGDGTEYTFEMLSQIEGTGVSKTDDNTYVVMETDTIAEGDSFIFQDEPLRYVVRFGDGVGLRIEGDADFGFPIFVVEYGGWSIGARLERLKTITFTRNEETDRPTGIVLACKDVSKENCVNGINFEYVGLQIETKAFVQVQECWFYYYQGEPSGALYLEDTPEMPSLIVNCDFVNCQKAAIAGNDNIPSSVYVWNCKFVENSQQYSDIPQLNLTAAKHVWVDTCTLLGGSTESASGAIGVCNLAATEGNLVEIVDCQIENHRYGISTTGAMNVWIEGCKLRNNRFEADLTEGDGGCAICFNDPDNNQTAKVMECLIEGSHRGVVVNGCKDINLGRIDVDKEAPEYNSGQNVFRNNGFDGLLYDLCNNSANTVYAQNNTWNVEEQTRERIENVILHKSDDASLGEVVYMPPYASEETAINSATSHQRNTSAKVYDMQGRRIDEKSSYGRMFKRPFIVDGKKVFR